MDCRGIVLPEQVQGDRPMSTAKVWRHARDWKGQTTESDEAAYLGVVDGVILGSTSARALRGFPALVDTSGQAAFPKDAPITVEPGDRVEIAAMVYVVRGPVEWSEPTIWGTDFGYRWLTIESTSN